MGAEAPGCDELLTVLDERGIIMIMMRMMMMMQQVKCEEARQAQGVEG